jgi:hypothetical protein
MGHRNELRALLALVIAAPMVGAMDRSMLQRPSIANKHGLINAAVSCRATDGMAENFKSYVVEVVTGSDTASTSMRQAWGIPSVADTAIYFVTDSILCDQASRAHAVQAHQSVNDPPAVSVLRVGNSRYVVFNGARSGEYLTYFVFDSAFVFVKAIIS